MTFRILGLVPAIALLATGVVHAQSNNASTGGGGQMAYPDSLPSGRVTIPAPTRPDTGNMAYPTSPGGVSQAAPTGRDTGNMAYPTGGSSLTGTRAPMRGKPMGTPAAASPASSASGMAAARSLETAPGETAVPYSDFSAPAAPMKRGHAVMRRPRMTHAAMKKPMAAKPAAPAAPAATTPPPPAK